MRIIGGKLKGTRITAPDDLPVRPTTDVSKESLFNILNNHFDIEGTDVLDLFAGTGNMSYEFASRGAKSVVSVDKNFGCTKFISSMAKSLSIGQLNVFRSDVLKFIEMDSGTYDIIFADPPYDFERIPEMIRKIQDRQLLRNNGWLVVEHAALQKLDNLPMFAEKRIYGKSSFSIFRNNTA